MTKRSATKTTAKHINISRTATTTTGRPTRAKKPATKTAAGQSRELPKVAVSTPRLPKNKAQILKSRLAYKGKVFSVYTEEVREPNGVEAVRDVVRHSGSVVVLAVDETTNLSDPLIVIERQFRHAADQYLLELPAGRVEPGENVLAAAKRELIEETGYRAKKWTKLVRYYASPGFVGEWMEIYLATGIVAGKAEPEEDEKIEVRLLPLSQLSKMCAAGEIHDGKTIVGTLIYAQRLRDLQ
jgi:ADP-ribose pyrophosphatase